MGVEEVLAESKSRIEEFVAPVNGGVGEDVSYNEKFEALKTETDKASSVSGEPVNWGNVESFASELLIEKSKDFRVACYLAAAKARSGQVSQLLDAMVLMNELQKAFWNEMHPPLKRLRARAGMFQWFIETAGPPAMDIKVTAKDFDTVKVLEDVMKQLDSELREKFADSYPGLGKVRDAVRHLVQTCPKPEAPKPAAPAAPPPGEAPPSAAPQASAQAAPAPTVYAAPSVPTEVVAIELLTDVNKALESIPRAGLLLVRIAGMLRTAKPENPEAYRLSRMGMWLELVDTPVVVDGNTLVPAPPSDLSARFATLAAGDNWLDLINEAEEAASTFILWLDPHRWVATAMDRMGALFLKAKKALLLEMAVMMQRMPTLAKLNYSGGEPFADGQTKMWLESEVAAVLGSGGGGGGASNGAGASVLDEPLEQAKGLVVQGKLGEGIEVVARAAASAPTPALRFRGRLALAQLCLRAGKFDIARAQLEGLHRIIETHNLSAWDPPLCSEVYGALFAAHLGANAGGGAAPESMAAQQLAFERLCQLDPGSALKLAGDSGSA